MPELNSEVLLPARNEQRPVANQVKKYCLKLAWKYISEYSQACYSSSACEEDSVDQEG